MDVRVGPWRRLSTKLRILNCGVGEDLRVLWTARKSFIDFHSLNIHWKVDAGIEAPILWPPDVKNWFTGKDPDAGKDWRRKERRLTEDEMVRWHHRLNGHQFEQILWIGDGQESLVCCSPWDHKESDTTERLNWIVPRTTISLWATTCRDWKNPDIPGSFADGRNVETRNNTLEWNVSRSCGVKLLKMVDVASMWSVASWRSSWKVDKMDRLLAVSAKYINQSDNLRTRNSQKEDLWFLTKLWS